MLYESIKHIYPSILDSQFSLQDDGTGPYIKSWAYSSPAPTPEEILAVTPIVTFQALVSQFDNAIEAYLHAEAVSAGYTNIERACMYSSELNPYQGESRGFVKWAGEVWAYCYGELLKVEKGERSMPTVAEILSELPVRPSLETP